jgi:hypothetical protein
LQNKLSCPIETDKFCRESDKVDPDDRLGIAPSRLGPGCAGLQRALASALAKALAKALTLASDTSAADLSSASQPVAYLFGTNGAP